MRFITWNVNGLRAVYKKGFEDFFNQVNADIFCIQETKMQLEQLDFSLPNYHYYFNSAVKKGYSGTAIFTKEEPISVSYGIGAEKYDQEGRVITLEFEKFYMLTVYTPNSQRELTRLSFRMDFEDALRDYLLSLNKAKPVIMCGDLNVAHQEIDLKNPKTNHKNAGFTDEEREKMTLLLSSGFIDTYRYLYPTETDCYTWWSYMMKAREKNIGWRIDYFIVSENIKNAISDVKIHKDIMGSDHCPVELIIKEDLL